MRKVFTTTQAGKLCTVTARTVTKWFDSGRLRGFRIPGSQDRRIPRKYLRQFMIEHGVPTDELDREDTALVIVSDECKPNLDAILTAANRVQPPFDELLNQQKLDKPERVRYAHGLSAVSAGGSFLDGISIATIPASCVLLIGRFDNDEPLVKAMGSSLQSAGVPFVHLPNFFDETSA